MSQEQIHEFKKHFNIKLVTQDGIGSAWVDPKEVEDEEDGTVTVIIEAWPETNRALSLAFVSFQNHQRAVRWHPQGLSSWSLSDWSVALAGEVGELCNVVKKLNRVRDGLQQKAVDPSQLKEMLADEIGDVYAYLDLVAQAAGLSLEQCLKNKFNKISEREGFPERL
jgi:NTP pyrophosphatase (non-canonical NTP hydrolase)